MRDRLKFAESVFVLILFGEFETRTEFTVRSAIRDSNFISAAVCKILNENKFSARALHTPQALRRRRAKRERSTSRHSLGACLLAING